MTFRRSRDLSAAGWLAAGRPVHVMKIEGGSNATLFCVPEFDSQSLAARTLIQRNRTPITNGSLASTVQYILLMYTPDGKMKT